MISVIIAISLMLTESYPCVMSYDCSSEIGKNCSINGVKNTGVRCSHPTVSIGKTCGDSHDDHRGNCMYRWANDTLPSNYYSIDDIHNATYCSGDLVCYGNNNESLDLKFLVFLSAAAIIALFIIVRKGNDSV